MQKNRFLKVQNSLLELEKYFIKLKDKKLKDREVEIKIKIEELFLQPIILSIYDMHKFEQIEVKKIKPIINTWYDCLINYIPDPRRKSV